MVPEADVGGGGGGRLKRDVDAEVQWGRGPRYRCLDGASPARDVCLPSRPPVTSPFFTPVMRRMRRLVRPARAWDCFLSLSFSLCFDSLCTCMGVRV